MLHYNRGSQVKNPRDYMQLQDFIPDIFGFNKRVQFGQQGTSDGNFGGI